MARVSPCRMYLMVASLGLIGMFAPRIVYGADSFMVSSWHQKVTPLRALRALVKRLDRGLAQPAVEISKVVRETLPWSGYGDVVSEHFFTKFKMLNIKGTLPKSGLFIRRTRDRRLSPDRAGLMQRIEEHFKAQPEGKEATPPRAAHLQQVSSASPGVSDPATDISTLSRESRYLLEANQLKNSNRSGSLLRHLQYMDAANMLKH